MKKKLLTVLALVLAFAAFAGLAGCSKSGGSGAETVKVLKIGMECGYAPYNWSQNDDSDGAVAIADSAEFANGYDVMMAKYLAEKMGYGVEIHKIDWDTLPLAVQSGKIDAVIAGQSITSGRKESVDFTTPYYYASVVALTKADSPYASAAAVEDLAGAVCTSQINTIWYDVLQQIPEAQILPAMETVPAMLVALESGKVDLLVCDMPTAMAAVVAYSSMTIPELGEGFEVSQEEVEIGISLQKGNEELLKQFNEALATLTEDDFIKMMNEAIAIQPLSEGEGE